MHNNSNTSICPGCGVELEITDGVTHQYMPLKQSNYAMLGFAKHKYTLEYLEPPAKFSMTIADVASYAGTSQYIAKIEEWARAIWGDWKAHHKYIQEWVHVYKS